MQNVVTWSWANWITVGLMAASILAVSGFLAAYASKQGWIGG